jgi:hypothetical protein
VQQQIIYVVRCTSGFLHFKFTVANDASYLNSPQAQMSIKYLHQVSLTGRQPVKLGIWEAQPQGPAYTLHKRCFVSYAASMSVICTALLPLDFPKYPHFSQAISAFRRKCKHPSRSNGLIAERLRDRRTRTSIHVRKTGCGMKTSAGRMESRGCHSGKKEAVGNTMTDGGTGLVPAYSPP